jgi:hypothetical protein
MGVTLALLAVPGDELELIRKDSSLLEQILEEEEDRLEDLEKSWDGIAYLLSGHPLFDSAEPVTDLSRVLYSGQAVDPDQDLGSGPAMYLTPSQVGDAARELSGITPEALRSRYNGADMRAKKIYPGQWTDEEFEYLEENFSILKEFYIVAAKDGHAVISMIS